MQDSTVRIRLPSKLKAAAQRATREKPGGLSQVIRELLSAWLATQATPPPMTTAKK